MSRGMVSLPGLVRALEAEGYRVELVRAPSLGRARVTLRWAEDTEQASVTVTLQDMVEAEHLDGLVARVLERAGVREAA